MNFSLQVVQMALNCRSKTYTHSMSFSMLINDLVSATLHDKFSKHQKESIQLRTKYKVEKKNTQKTTEKL